MTTDRSKRIVIVGGGVIGLAAGWRLARRGCSVTVFDRDAAGRAASWVAGGMVAPLAEVGFEDDAFLDLGRESVGRYKSFLAELCADGGADLALQDNGILMAGFHRDDTEQIRRLFDFRLELGLPVEWMNGAEAREFEPLLSPRVTAAMWIPGDCIVDNRALVAALRAALVARGGTVRDETPVERVVVEGDRARGVIAGGERIEADWVVIAAGAWSARIDGIPEEFVPPVRPIKGQILELRADESCPLTRAVRAPDVYLVPKPDGRILVGASQEEMGFDETPTAGAVWKLLERGWEAVPSIYDLELLGVRVGLRPGTRDNYPIIGRTALGGLAMATGHFRHGILLAPVTGDAICDALLDNTVTELLQPFAPSRFERVRAGGHAADELAGGTAAARRDV